MIHIEVVDDALSEPQETLTVSLRSVASSASARLGVLVSGETRTYAIAPSDAVAVSLAVSTQRIVEGGDGATFRVSLSGGELTSALAVEVAVHPDSTADARDVVGLPGW